MTFGVRHPDSIDAFNAVFALARGDEAEFLAYVDDLGFDWFVDVCQQHSIGGFAYERVEALERVTDLPASGRRRLRLSHLEQWAAAENQAWELERVDEVMQTAQRPYLLLKGLHLAHRFYGSVNSAPWAMSTC